MPRRGKRGAKKGDETQDRIVEAALDTLKEEGFQGATARSIAKRGDFNAALIYYYFGSVNELLLEALDATSESRIARYRDSRRPRLG